MTPSSEHSRRAPSAVRTATIACFLAGILLLGFALRLYLADMPGNEFDVGVNQGWAKSAVQLGFAKSYSEQVDGNMLPNYPPLSLLMFGSVGHVFKLVFSPEFDRSLPVFRMMIKLPSILADLLGALGLYFVVRRWRGQRAAFLAAIIYTFHPAVFYNSAIWGQTDGIFSAVLVWAMLCYSRRWHFAAGVLIAAAGMLKAQTIMVLPLLAALYFVHAGWRGLLHAFLGALLMTVLGLLPFAIGGALTDVYNVYVHSVGYYPIVSSAAYNFWWMLYGDAAGGMQNTDLLLGLLSFKKAGYLLFGLSYCYLLVLTLRKLKRLPANVDVAQYVFAAAAFAALAFFLFNVEMHERYLYPFVAFGLPLVFVSRKGAVLYWVITIAFLFNMMGWLPWSIIDRTLYSAFPMLDVIIACVQMFCFFSFAGLLARMCAAPLSKTEKWLLTKVRAPFRRAGTLLAWRPRAA